jgi:cell division ATPase FtsA
MTPTSKQVDEISEVLALLMEDFVEETPQGSELPEGEEEDRVSEEVLARRLAKSLATKGGEVNLRGLLEAARGLMRVSMEVV